RQFRGAQRRRLRAVDRARIRTVDRGGGVRNRLCAVRSASRRVLAHEGVGQRRQDQRLRRDALPRIRAGPIVTIAAVLLVALAVPAVTTCAYLLVMSLLSRAPAPSVRGARFEERMKCFEERTQCFEERMKCFDVIVPAHDEAASIAAVVADLQRIEWP